MGSPVSRSISTMRPAGAVRRFLTVATLAGGVIAASAAAAGSRSGHGDSYHVWVDVLDVDPIVRVEHVDEPVERCYDTRPSSRSSASWRRDGRHDDRYHDAPPRRERAGGGGAFVGGLVGGLLGNRIGDGRGKETELTVAGALLGAALGASATRGRDSWRDPYDRHDRHASSWRAEPVRRCEVTWESRPVERVDGYEVVYRYAGRRFTKIVDDHPGERMRVRVDLAPA